MESFAEMLSGRYQIPLRFGRPSKRKEFNESGFSDHFSLYHYNSVKKEKLPDKSGSLFNLLT